MIGKKFAALFATLVVMSVLAGAQGGSTTAAGTGGGVICQLGEICGTIMGIVPIVALLMFVTAGLVYAGGQIMGAETRSRANVWSTAMLVGGIIGLVLAASAPYFLQIFAQAALGGTGTGIGTAATCGPC